MSTDKKHEMILDKAARLAVLMELDNRGLLDGMSYQAIADALKGPNEEAVNRSTILRDLRDLDTVRAKLGRFQARVEYLKHK